MAHLIRAALLALFLLAGGAAAEPFAPATTHHVAMRLEAESAAPAAGNAVTLAIVATPDAGWHGYWQNPGDAGVETKVAWTLPAGAGAGALRYPVPQRLLIAGLMNYVYEAPYALLADVRVPAGLAPGTRVPVRAAVDYLVCSATICVPEQQTLDLALTIGDGAVAPAARARFDGWRRAVPKPLGSAATWQVMDGSARIAVPWPAGQPTDGAYFYPGRPGAIDMAAPQTVTRDGERLLVTVKAAAAAGAAAATPLAGVLAVGGQGFALQAASGVVTAAQSVWRAALFAFAGALLGGLILNVMPCVFPILSLKALGLARSGESERAARGEALAYAAGAVLACLALGGTLLALRAGGSAAGWAFQLQQPRMVVVLLLLAVAITANLLGAFELPTPRFAGERAGAAGAFGTGALAAFVATPCAGPFMGAALGAALVLPWPAALAVFAGLGLGLALPFLLIGFVPALRRRLPRPGAWMVTLRRILAVPMALTAVALLWLLRQEAGMSGLWIGVIASIGMLLCLVLIGRQQRRGWGVQRTALMFLVIIVLGTVPWVRGAPPVATSANAFSEPQLAALRAQGRPVFAYFTADWCLTCKVNEKAAIDTATARAAFARGNVAVLVGDWTDGDPALGRFIAAHGRAGVPLYLWYPAGGGEPRVLPQVLTSGILAALPG